jgi:hypothetical protein
MVYVFSMTMRVAISSSDKGRFFSSKSPGHLWVQWAQGVLLRGVQRLGSELAEFEFSLVQSDGKEEAAVAVLRL